MMFARGCLHFTHHHLHLVVVVVVVVAGVCWRWEVSMIKTKTIEVASRSVRVSRCAHIDCGASEFV
jgi:hypothetical protein